MKLQYQHCESNKNHGFEGIQFEISEIEEIFPKHLKEKLLDSEGTDELVEEFTNFDDINTTGFDNKILLDIFKLDDVISEHKSWRIGEVFAEFHLENNNAARFYYNELRDAKNPLGNRTGADLVGFIELEGDTVFLFGEVKTSNEQKSPPQVLYSRKNKKGYVQKGMVDQLKDLAVNIKDKNTIIRTLGFKVKDLHENHPFRLDFKKSLESYTKSSSRRFHIFGVLIRDTRPEENDIKSRYNSLLKNIENETGFKMIALYVPIEMKEWNDLIG